MKLLLVKTQRRMIEIDPSDKKKLLRLEKEYRKEISPDSLEIYLEDKK